MIILAPAIPVLLFVLLWGIFYKVRADLRSSFLFAAVVWGTYLVGTTELLSLFKWIAFWPLVAAWSAPLVAALIVWTRRVGNPKELFQRFDVSKIPRFELGLLLGICLIALLVGLIASVAPPTNWDSMTYHMARVMHLIQDQSVADYPTHILRQLFLNPGSEFIFMLFQILSGTDRLANLVQWFSMIGSCLGVSLIARLLGAGRRGQIFSAAISMTIPMGILQGSSTQNDYAAAFWMVCFVYFLIVLKSETNFKNALFAGASLGLAVLTKATIYLFGLPFIIWLLFPVLKTDRGQAARILATLAGMALVLNLGHYVRNTSLFGSPLGLASDVFSTGGQVSTFQYANDIISLPELVSNTVRNTAINLGTPLEGLNTLLNEAVVLVHQRLGLSVTDPRTTWPGAKFQIPDPSFIDDSAGNPLQVILIAITLIMVAVVTPRRRDRVVYCLVLIAAFLLFSMYLKWQPWNNRLELPLFVLWTAVIGSSLAEIKIEWLGNALMSLVFLAAMPWVFGNASRPLLGPENIFIMDRTEQYFRVQHSLWSTYPRVAGELTNLQCRQIGLYFDGGTWEYPLWVLLQQGLGNDVRIESVNVENVSARQASQFPPFTPCAVLVANPLPVDNFKIGTRDYSVAFVTKFISVLTPK